MKKEESCLILYSREEFLCSFGGRILHVYSRSCRGLFQHHQLLRFLRSSRTQLNQLGFVEDSCRPSRRSRGWLKGVISISLRGLSICAKVGLGHKTISRSSLGAETWFQHPPYCFG